MDAPTQNDPPSDAEMPVSSGAVGAAAAAFGDALVGLVAQFAAPLAVKDSASGRILWANLHYAVLFGLDAGQVVGAVEAELIPEGQRGALRTADQAALSGAAPILGDLRIERDGRRREFSVARVALAGGDGAPRRIASLWIETTAANQREQQLQQALVQIEQQQAAVEAVRREAHDLALRDPATGLYQRAQFDDLLRREVDLSLREHREFALASIELDALGDAALAAGPAAEQRVLEALGRLLRGNTRAMDASCRLDARRFAVLLSGVGLATAHSRMEGMRRQCATQIVVEAGRDFGFTVSMGVASFPHTAHTQDELMRAAAAALAEAQRRGGNHVTLASIRFEGT